MGRNYDAVAWFYDRLSRLILGRAPRNAQLYLLKVIPANSKLLIIGGGTGWILEELAHTHPAGLTITYVEASRKMITHARKKNTGTNEITFIALPVEQAKLEGPYDIVLTPFLFDNFREDTMDELLNHVGPHVGSHALWLWCDFRNTDVLWQRALLAIMYYFFRMLCNIEATELPDIQDCFRRHRFLPMEQHTFMKGFIISGIYKRDP